MGLILNGIVGGTKYEDEMVSADQLIKIFKIDNVFRRITGKVIRFDLHKSQKVKKNGETFHPQQISILCTTSGVFEGNQFELLYYKNRSRRDNMSQKGQAQLYIYTPRKIIFTGDSHPVNIENEKEMAVFMLLHNNCETSPIKKRGSRTVYTLFDSIAQANNQHQKMEESLRIYQAISNDNVESLRLIAQGMRLGNFTDKTEKEVRSALYTKFESMKAAGKVTQFIEQFESKVSTFQGIILDAVHRGILVQVTNKGFYHYQWGHGASRSGQTLYTVPKGLVPIEALITFAVDNYESVLVQLKDEIKKEKNRAGLDQSVDDALKDLLDEDVEEVKVPAVEEKPVKKVAHNFNKK